MIFRYPGLVMDEDHTVKLSMEMLPENLRKQLAVAVRSVQWSYAIFWSLSASEQGTLGWADGYYNGDIKTRKRVPAMELKADELGLERSDQLRELYKSLLEDEIDQQSNRPSAALSPDDLSDAEWYYLVCMSFVFKLGEGLPGRAVANEQTIWLCNAPYADSKVFSRSLLAKVGIPLLKSRYCGVLPPFQWSDRIGCDRTGDLEIEKRGALQENMPEEFNMDSPDDYLNGCKHNQQTEDAFIPEGLSREASQVQSGDFLDDEFSNGGQDSLNSSEYISEVFVDQEKDLSSPICKNMGHIRMNELQNGSHKKFSSLNVEADDWLHYRRTLSVILRSSNHLNENSCHSTGCLSSFTIWKKGAIVGSRPMIQQNMLKKILFDVPLMHVNRNDNGGKVSLGTLESCEMSNGHNFSDEQGEYDKLLSLSSMVPSIGKTDKLSILNDTIKYLMELEARIEELESCVGLLDHEVRPRRNCMDLVELSSDNYDNQKINNVNKAFINKRKACDIDESYCSKPSQAVHKDGMPMDLKVSMKEKEVLIDLKCPSREYILVDFIDAINSLSLDVYSVQSSTLDGILTLTLKSKFRGAAVAPAVMIKKALWKVAYNS
ncbi:hypothetical protein Tsubulata_025172 [Turnera subulata]|uniref:BHLH domain-containing protein n=1 Tax=Turnera subulata TaxID=218843 RepID=A0A9Q0F7Z6_9ROSI|nr:hypothetical protein Tsubulata_025172 [Turnera subulata]